MTLKKMDALERAGWIRYEENIHFYKSTSSGFVIYWGLKMKEVM